MRGNNVANTGRLGILFPDNTNHLGHPGTGVVGDI